MDTIAVIEERVRLSRGGQAAAFALAAVNLTALAALALAGAAWLAPVPLLALIALNQALGIAVLAGRRRRFLVRRA